MTRVHWPDLTFPPINLWNAPIVRAPRGSAGFNTRRDQQKRFADPQQIKRLLRGR
jgi:hypothetical protein